MLLTSANDAPVGISARQMPENSLLRWIPSTGPVDTVTFAPLLGPPRRCVTELCDEV